MLYQLRFTCEKCGYTFCFITKADTEKEEKLLELPRTCIKCKSLVRPEIIKLGKQLYYPNEIKNNIIINFLRLDAIHLYPFEITIKLDSLISEGFSGTIKIVKDYKPIYSLAVLPLENDYQEVKVKKRNRNDNNTQSNE